MVQPSSVSLNPDYGVVNNVANRGFSAQVLASGNWGVTATQGTYRTLIYSNIQGINSTVPGPRCVVPETGTVACNIVLPATNFQRKKKHETMLSG